ncbi:MAG: glutamyl-tRNA reductase [Myxococcota bacterium]
MKTKPHPLDVPLAVVGVDYKSACSAYRGDLVTAKEERTNLFVSIKSIDPDAGFIALETCNRVEWIVSTEQPEWMASLLTAKMASRWREKRPDLLHYPIPSIYIGDEAARHIFRLVAGLESFVPGEAQIAGQFQRALGDARKLDSSSIILNGLSGIAGRAAKFSYRIGVQSNKRRGIHGLVLKFIDAHFGGELSGKRIGVLGMGEIGRRSAALIEEALNAKVVKINRTVAEKNRGEWRPIVELPDIILELDALVVATGSREPVVSARELSIPKRMPPLLILDIGVPRQVSHDIEELKGVDYRNIDDLMKINLEAVDRTAIANLEGEIEKFVSQFKRFCRERNMVVFLDRTRKRHYEITERQIPDFISTHLGKLEPAARKKVETELKRMFRTYTNEVFDSIHAALEDYFGKSGG